MLVQGEVGDTDLIAEGKGGFEPFSMVWRCH